MSKIKKLSQTEAQKIAAGQVVERPVNIVKELLENAVDAGATQITVYVEDGGKKLIRVVDNGSGMDEQDAQLCFEKHTTSKLVSFDELTRINTFGFRGEALASIAAVSKVTLTTKESDQQAGIRLNVHGGILSTGEYVASPGGTDIQVESLFYNVPAREKFLKKRETELRQITLLIQAFSFALPNLHISLYSDGKQLIHCPAVTKVIDRCAQLWEQKAHEHALAIDHTQEDISITGALSDHQLYRYDRSQLFFFVNNRWVKNGQLGTALLRGYHNVIPTGRFPLAALRITVDPTLVDSNVHPKKEEVIFMHPKKVEKALELVARTALEEQLSQKIQKKVSFSAPLPTPLYERYTTNKISQRDQEAIVPAPSRAYLWEQSEEKYSERPSYRLIGQYNKTYLLIEQENSLIIIDQHAAHERILYEEFQQRFESLPTVPLLFPAIVSCTPDDIALLEPVVPLLEKNGIVIDQFGTQELLVKSSPIHIKHINFTELVHQLIGWIKEEQMVDQESMKKHLNEKLHAQMACKAAVKAGDELTNEKMHEIVTTLSRTANRFACPHGRPTRWEFTIEQLEKKFKRDYN